MSLRISTMRLVAGLSLWLGWAMPASASAQCVLPDVAMHVPAGIDAPVPLLILLHGSTSTGAAMLADSGLAATADRHGFILIAPDGGIAADKGFVWNIPGVATVSGNLPTAADRDDVAYLLGQADALIDAGCVDAARVYVTGLSGGGRMASWLGCVAADRIAAMAPVVGLRAGRPSQDDPMQPDPKTCRPVRPVPVIAFAGDVDRTNPIQGGGASYWRYTMHAAEQRWAALNGCRTTQPTRWIAADVYQEGYGDCRTGAEVVGRVTRGGGHSWAVADNEVMWAFLSRHRR